MSAEAQTPAPQKDKHINVYYFYGNYRCVSCYKIEKYTKEALYKYFGDELESGKLAYKTVNVEKKSNAHFIDDYGLYTKSVIVSLVNDGKEVRYKNLDNVWGYLGNREKFYEYIKDEVSLFLKE